MNLDQNTLPLGFLTSEVIEQRTQAALPEPYQDSLPNLPPAIDYTPFVLALAVFVVVLKGYQR